MSSQLHPPGATLLSFVLGLLGDAHSHGVRAHARGCRRCSQDVLRLRYQTAHAAFALAPVEPPPLLRDALLQAAGEIHRLSPMAKNVAKLLCLPHKQISALLSMLDTPRHWRSLNGIWLLERKSPAPSIFLRLPQSTQIDDEMLRRFLPDKDTESYRLLVLQGNGVDQDGRIWRSGQQGSVERFVLTANAGCDLIVLFTYTDTAGRKSRHRRRNRGTKEGRNLGAPKVRDIENLQ